MASSEHSSSAEQFDSFVELGRSWEGGFWRSLICLVTMIAIYYYAPIALLFILAEFYGPAYAALYYDYPTGWMPWANTSLSRAVFEHAYWFGSAGLIVLIVCTLVPAFHKCSVLSLFTLKRRFDWLGFWSSFGWYAAVWIASFCIWYAIDPGSVIYVFEARPFLIFLPFTLILLPFQVLGEEIFFRGYLMQLVGRLTRNRWIILIVPAAIFGALHFGNPNPEFNDIWAKAGYVVFGLYWGLLAIKTDGIEHSVGIHLSNNIIAILLFGSNFEPATSPTVFFAWAGDNLVALIDLICLYAVHYFCVFKLPGLWKRHVSRS